MNNENQMNNQENSFESELKNLENITNHLEQGNVPLKESLKEFKQGVALNNNLKGRLANAKTALAQIVNSDGTKSPYSRDKNGQDTNDSVDNDQADQHQNGGFQPNHYDDGMPF